MNKFIVLLSIICTVLFTSCGNDNEPDDNILNYTLTCKDAENITISDNGHEASISTRGNNSYELSIAGDFSNIVFDSYLPWAEASHHNNIITVAVTSPKDGENESGYIKFTVFNDSKSASGKIYLTYRKTTYDDLRNEERDAINFFLKDQIVASTTPSNIAQFQVGTEAPFYWLDDEHNVAVRIVSMGNGGIPENGETVYFRFERWNLLEYFKTGVLPPSTGNASSIDDSPASLIVNDYLTPSSAQWGKGLQMPLLRGIPYGSQLLLVVASPSGLTSEQSSVVPFLYNIRYFLPDNTIVDNEFPNAPVFVEFSTQAIWNLYGVTSACSWRFFNLPDRKPSNFPYSDAMATGFGGLFLFKDVNGNVDVVDAACPIERDAKIRIWLNSETGIAKCQSCGSEFNIFEQHGLPISGPAATQKIALKRYSVTFSNSPYATISN